MPSPHDLDPTTAAYHEAGHALMAHLLGGRVVQVTLEVDDDGEIGRTTVEWHGHSVAERRRCSALVALAGPVAEARWRGDVALLEALSAWHDDWEEVRAALAAEAGARNPAALLTRWLREVHQQFADAAAWELLCRLADVLEAHDTLDAVLLDELLGTP
ncbi:MAG: M50 family metallopeptidase [Planctomycetes bacterium]|nr:M50 family metallopeptidase [Planctomycetota bacterium]